MKLIRTLFRAADLALLLVLMIQIFEMKELTGTWGVGSVQDERTDPEDAESKTESEIRNATDTDTVSKDTPDFSGLAAVSFAGEEELTAETAAVIEEVQEITVLITNKGEGGYWHSTLSFSFAADVMLTTGDRVRYLGAGETLELDADDYAVGDTFLLEKADDKNENISENAISDSADILKNSSLYLADISKDSSLDSVKISENAVTDPTDISEDDISGNIAAFTLDFSMEAETGDVRTYAGILEITVTEDGFLLRNTLSLEEYLRYVVPAEMPASYPEEALKAQAICARTYALHSAVSGVFAKYGADISDDTSCQVYNTQGTDERTDAAVFATAGEYLVFDGEPAECYYFSTSCGVTTDAAIWGEEISYLKSVLVSGISAKETEHETEHETADAAAAETSEASDLETVERSRVEVDSGNGENPESGDGSEDGENSITEGDVQIGELLKSEEYLRSFLDDDTSGVETGESWYRWEVSFSLEILAARLEEKIGEVLSLEVTQRGSGGVAVELTIYGSNGQKVIQSQYAIREFFRLGDGASCARQDGTVMSESMLLPSAFFYIQMEADGTVMLVGGGFGHGCGMSQNAAKAYAKEGVDAYEILSFFYPGTKIYRAEK